MYFIYFYVVKWSKIWIYFYSQAPCDNGSKIQNYILQWDEVFVYSNLKCRLTSERAGYGDPVVSVSGCAMASMNPLPFCSVFGFPLTPSYSVLKRFQTWLACHIKVNTSVFLMKCASIQTVCGTKQNIQYKWSSKADFCSDSLRVKNENSPHDWVNLWQSTAFSLQSLTS